MDNQWADPEGIGLFSDSDRVQYLILNRTTGAVETHLTTLAHDYGRARNYHCLAPADQAFADEIVKLIQQACEYFYKKNNWTPLEGVEEATLPISDDEVRTRIERLDRGENTREAERTKLDRYPLTDLPWAVQRALIERVDEVKIAWGFEILGPLSPEVESES